jgi:alpha-galactosidase
MDLGKTPAPREALLKLFAQWKESAKFYFDDYYPLTDYSMDQSAWMGWQFAQPDEKAGMVQVFRRKNSPFDTAHLKLRGLDAKARYVFKNLDTASESSYAGAELLEQGLPVSITTMPGALILQYRKIEP